MCNWSVGWCVGSKGKCFERKKEGDGFYLRFAHVTFRFTCNKKVSFLVHHHFCFVGKKQMPYLFTHPTCYRSYADGLLIKDITDTKRGNAVQVLLFCIGSKACVSEQTGRIL